MAEVVPSSVSFAVQWGVASLALWECRGWIPCQLFLIEKYIGYRFPTDSKLWARTWGILELDWDGKPTLNMSNAIVWTEGLAADKWESKLSTNIYLSTFLLAGSMWPTVLGPGLPHHDELWRHVWDKLILHCLRCFCQAFCFSDRSNWFLSTPSVALRYRRNNNPQERVMFRWPSCRTRGCQCYRSATVLWSVQHQPCQMLKTTNLNHICVFLKDDLNWMEARVCCEHP